jgi:serine protease
MNLSNRYVSLVLAALLAQSSQAQEVDSLSNLRKGKHKGSSDDHDTELLPLGSPSALRAKDKPERFVVKCSEGQDEEECLGQILAAFPGESAKVLHRLKKENAYAVSIKDMKPGTMDKLSFESYDDPIRQPLYIKESLEVHRELQFGGQQVPYGIDMVKAQEAWDQFGARGANVKVCVLDTGLRSNHADFNQEKLTGYDGNEAVTPWFNDGEGHGTHVTGTIAAADNTRGVVGVAPEAEIHTVRVFDNNGVFFGSDIIAAAEACQDAGANVISMSLGGSGSSFLERRTLEDLYDDGIISVAAAGNSGGTDFLYPAAYEVVLSVAAVDSNRNLASFSTRNSRVDVAGPGMYHDKKSRTPFPLRESW